MRKFTMKATKIAALLMLPLSLLTTSAQAAISGVQGPNFALNVSQDTISTPDGDAFKIWGYGVNGSLMQYPGPTLIVKQNDVVTITLVNNLPNLPGTTAPMPVSMIFPGQTGVTATGGTTGLLTQESSGPLDTVTYSFTASNPGTYMYQSGTRPGLQVEMGLVGALIVRPSNPLEFTPGAGNVHQAYNHPSTAYDHEYLFILTEMDPSIHYLVEFGLISQVDNTISHPVLWFINGRNGPDTVFPTNDASLPLQPYGSLARQLPGEKTLLRVIGAGRDIHPFHTHGNNAIQIARDGQMLSTGGGTGANLAESDYTLQTHPGATYDAIWTWDGSDMGWDIYGTAADGLAHTCSDLSPVDGFDDTSHEFCADHGIRIPVDLPKQLDLTFGGFYSGSPFLGPIDALPPGEGGLNLTGGMFFIWHSHTEKELVNNDIFPGGMMTFMVVEPPSVNTSNPIEYSPF